MSLKKSVEKTQCFMDIEHKFEHKFEAYLKSVLIDHCFFQVSIAEQLTMDSDDIITETKFCSAQPHIEDIQTHQEEIKLVQDTTENDGILK